MKVALGSDHRGEKAVDVLTEYLEDRGVEVKILGPRGMHSSDYPESAYLVGRAVSRGEAERGILVCGSGNGVAMAANKVPGVRAALAREAVEAEMSRRHNDANVLCLSADSLTDEDLRGITDAFLEAPFEGGRHARRVMKIAAIERGEDPAMVGGEDEG